MKTALAIALTLMLVALWWINAGSPAGAGSTLSLPPTPTPALTVDGRLESVVPGDNTANLTMYNFGEPPRMLFYCANGTEEAPTNYGKDSLCAWTVALMYYKGKYYTVGNTEWRMDCDPVADKNNQCGAYSIWTGGGPDAAVPWHNTEKVRVANDGDLIVGQGTGTGEFTNHIGERNLTSVLGGMIRSPDLAPGVADQAGADLTLECGAGTGKGTDCRIIFRVDVSDGPGTAVKRKYTLATFGRGVAHFNTPVSVQGVTLTGKQLDRLLALIGE